MAAATVGALIAAASSAYQAQQAGDAAAEQRKAQRDALKAQQDADAAAAREAGQANAERRKQARAASLLSDQPAPTAGQPAQAKTLLGA